MIRSSFCLSFKLMAKPCFFLLTTHYKRPTNSQLTISRLSGTVPPLMLMIRLQRVGRRNHPEFRVVVTEHTRGPKSNDFVEIVGSYNPHADTVALKGDRIKHWLSMGAQASDTVHNILIKQGVIEGKKRNVLPKKTVPQKEEEVKAESKEEPKTETAPAEEADTKEEETVSA